jgi:hypothetical protein
MPFNRGPCFKRDRGDWRWWRRIVRIFGSDTRTGGGYARIDSQNSGDLTVHVKAFVGDGVPAGVLIDKSTGLKFSLMNERSARRTM